MASSVFFRFKSQKEPTRVAFDGTGISVFELKREIIVSNRLGDGTDFELVISSEDTNEEYDDDTFSIPRSTTVLAKRLPAHKPGRGGAARYVSGKIPQTAKASHWSDSGTMSMGSAPKHAETPGGSSDMNGAQTEEERIAAMFKLGADQWAQQQREMANATPVFRSGPGKGKSTNVPDRPPPQGYVCYRCGEKGHWIQACPTNDDPSYVNRPRVKRTTGIPRSFLKTVERPTAVANDGTVDETKQPAGVMVNADGEWVVAEPDKASWDQYQAKAKVSAAAQEAVTRGNELLQEKGLECPIDKRLFVEPSATPCCQKTFCSECITNALLENDLRCPYCSAENILLDDLKPDAETAERIRAFEQEQRADQDSEATRKSREVSPDNKPAPKQESTEAEAGKTKAASKLFPVAETEEAKGESSKRSASKKRPADSPISNPHTPVPPGTQATAKEAPKIPSTALTNPAPGQPNPTGNSGPSQARGPTGLPVPTTVMDMSMNMMPSLPLGNGFYNPMAMANLPMASADVNWNMPWQGNYYPQPVNMAGMGYPNGAMGYQYAGQNLQMPMNHTHSPSVGVNGPGIGTFHNQQRNHFTGSKASEEDSAYFRKPVNPYRHQARRNMNRPTDYREI
ncbi:MAG: hypothetical protein Q9222_000659 [Ikaeria aurantiellina]